MHITYFYVFLRSKLNKKNGIMLGVGGSVQAMINSLKNNSRRKDRKKYFDRKPIDSRTKKGSQSNRKKIKAPAELLNKIKKEAIRDRKEALIKNVLLIVVTLLITASIIRYVQINYMDSIKKFLAVLYG